MSQTVNYNCLEGNTAIRLFTYLLMTLTRLKPNQSHCLMESQGVYCSVICDKIGQLYYIILYVGRIIS